MTTSDDATALALAVSTKRLTAREAMEAAIAAAGRETSLGALAALLPEEGLRGARRIDALGPDAAMPFRGVPTLAEDLGGPFAGLPVAAGSRAFARTGGGGGNGGQDGDLARRLRAAGFCPFGLTTSPEFALSLSSEPAIGPRCRNPLAPHLSAGASSGGAVAAGFVAIAHAADAGGSIRVPAAACGLVGLKPVRGSVPGGPSYENHIGGLAVELAVCRSVRDAAVVFAVAAAGRTGGPFPPPAFAPVPAGSLRIGLVADTGDAFPTDGERAEAVEAAPRSLEARGLRIVPLLFDAIDAAVRASARVFAGLVAANLAEFLARTGADASQVEPMTRSVAARGQAMSVSEVWSLGREMVLVGRDLWALFDAVDALLLSMLASAPRPLGAFPTDHADTELHFSRVHAFAPTATIANVSGVPALTLRFGTDRDGLPLPVQLLAPMGSENVVLALAAEMEAEGRWAHRFPVAGRAAA